MRRSIPWWALGAMLVVAAGLKACVYTPGSPSSTDLENIAPAIDLSPSERAALQAAPVLRIGYVPDWHPLSFLDAGEDRISGVAGAYADLLGKALGIRFELIKVDNRLELQRLMLTQEVDIVPLFSPWYSSASRFVFSRPFEILPEVFVTRSSFQGPDLTQYLAGKLIVTDAPVSAQHRLLHQVPEARVMEVENAVEGLDLVMEGHADAYVGNVAVVDGLVREKYHFALQIVNQTGLRLPLSVAVSDRYAWLVPLVNRALAAVPETTKRQILNSWTAVVYHPSEVDWRQVFKTLLPIGLVVVLVLGALFLAFVKYRREALQRRAAEAKLHGVTRYLPAVVFQARKDTEEHLSFDYVSGNSAEIWGLTPEEMRDEPWRFLDRIDARDREDFLIKQKQASDDRVPFLLEFRVRDAADHVRWIRGNAVPMQSQDDVMVWCGYWVDVSDSKQQEAELKAARDTAERAAQSKAHFLAVMSHEIRTPLNGVIGMLELIRQSELPAKPAAMLVTIDELANNLRGLLDEILDISKIEAGYLQLDVQPLDPRVLVADVVRLFHASAVAKGLSLQLETDRDVPVLVQGDRLRLRQILLNLVSNAIKFTQVGRVCVDVTLLSPPDQHGLAGLRFAVTDTGVGMDGATSEQLFAPYTQGQLMPEAGAPAGTGLGLSICRRITDAMGGEIALHEGPNGQGVQAVLDLHLPVVAFSFMDAVPYQRIHLSLANPDIDRVLREWLATLGGAARVCDGPPLPTMSAAPWVVFSCAEDSQIVSVEASDRPLSDKAQFDVTLLNWGLFLECLRGGRRDDGVAGEVQPHAPGQYACTVLVAEDHDVSRRLLVSQLEMLGCVVTACEDGEQAWDLLNSGQDFDVLITDGHMPRLGGVALLRRVRRADSTALRTLPVLLLSATPLSLPADVSVADTVVLLKPIRIRDIGRVLNTLLARVPVAAAESDPAAGDVEADAMRLPQALRVQFAEALREDQARLIALMQAQDADRIRHWVHRQAGALAAMGFNTLLDRAQALERMILEQGYGEPEIAAFEAFNAALSDLVGQLMGSDPGRS